MAPADIHRECSSALGISELQKSRQTDTQRHTDKLQEFRELSWHTDRQPPRQRLLRAACVSPHSLPGRLHLARNNASLSTQPHRNPQGSQVKRCAGSPCPAAARGEAAPHRPCTGPGSQLQQPRWGKEQWLCGCGIAVQRSKGHRGGLDIANIPGQPCIVLLAELRAHFLGPKLQNAAWDGCLLSAELGADSGAHVLKPATMQLSSNGNSQLPQIFLPLRFLSF